MQKFPVEEMKNDHVEGYCVCRVSVQSSPILHMCDSAIRPLGAPVHFGADRGQSGGSLLTPLSS